MKLFIHSLIASVCLILVTACGNQIGPDSSAIKGSWALDQSNEPDTEISNVIATFSGDGTSRFTFNLNLGDAAAPELRRYRAESQGTWRLDETVLTRTIDEMVVTPEIVTPESQAAADGYAEVLSQRQSAQFIIESVSETELLMLDPESGDTLLYTR